MCLILFSYNRHPDYRLILAANRDEFYIRPTKHLAFWNDKTDILAGRDLESNGTWLGITKRGRIAALTNFINPASQKEDAPSRGLLTTNFLSGKTAPDKYLESVKSDGHRYNGFNLIVGDGSEFYYYSNRGNGVQKLIPGLYGLCNHLLDTPWPKVVKGKAEFKRMIFDKEEINPENIFRLLADRSYAPDDKLPDTGMELEWERILSPLFITSSVYGTRSSSLILMKKSGGVKFIERTYVLKKPDKFEHQTKAFSFHIKG